MAGSNVNSVTGGLIEVRLNSLQMFTIDEVLEKVKDSFMMVQSWYQVGLSHKEELAAGRSVVLTFPARLGTMPADYRGAVPDVRAEWLPVIIRALKDNMHYRLADLLTGLYEAIAWGYGEELYEFDGLFDLATIAGCQRLLARRSVMEKMHNFTPAMLDNALAYVEGGHNGN